jgi:acyl-CoA synthetase (AMP-forming)/AMP-acid ligase II
MIIHSPFPDPDIPEMPLPDYVLSAVTGRRGKPALIEGATGRTWTFAELAQEVRSTASALAAAGLRKGDVFAICLPNIPEFVIAYYAVLSAGGVVTTLSPMTKPAEAAIQLQHSGARWLLTTSEIAANFAAEGAAAQVCEIFTVDDGDIGTPFATVAGGCAEPLHVDIVPDDPAVILYSSGTTGLPKGVVLTHRSLVAGVACLQPPADVTASDTTLTLCPLYHIAGMEPELNFDLAAGATVVTMPHFDMRQFLALIERHRVTRIVVSPPVVLMLSQEASVDDHDLSSLRVLTSGGAPLSGDVARACAARLNCRVDQAYGMTETVTVCFTPHDSVDRPGSVGPLVPGVTCRIVDVATGADVAPGETGELLVRSPSRMREYLDNPTATAATIDSDGWLHTGDIARADEDGWLYIVDRVKELIKYKAYQVAPAELEALLLTHPLVADAAVVPSPDALAGEVPKAFVVRRGVVSAEELMTFIADRVSAYKKVRRLEFVDAIPKSPSGKILRRLLVERERAAVDAAPQALVVGT